MSPLEHRQATGPIHGGVFVVGFPYVRNRYFETWRHVPEHDDYRFLLPSRWTAKKSKVKFEPPKDSRVFTTRTLFPSSDVPLFGGLLKGWMPLFPLWLLRFQRWTRLVYACSEPNTLTTLWFGLFTRLFGKKLVIFSWENIPYEKKLRGLSLFVHRVLVRLNLALAHGLVCGNQECERIHRRYTKKLITVIPMNGLDPKQFQPDPQERKHSPFQGNFVYTFIGAIGYRKGLDGLVRAFAKVQKILPNAHLVIAGNGEYEKFLERSIDEIGISEHVTRFPWLEQHEIVRLLSVSDVFVYPSIPYGGWAEQFGYSMAEASLMELPVISTNSGSISDVVHDGVTGILVPPNNVEALATAMEKLASDEQLRQQLGTAGRRFITNRYSHQSVAKQFANFFALVK